MRKSLIMLGCVAIIFSAGYATAFAHQPYLLGKVSNIIVVDPEVSKAYYAELNGKPAVYTIHSDKRFELYVNILVPDIAGITKDYSVSVVNSTGTIIAMLDGAHFTWQRWYEEFAGDWYWKGPEFKQDVPAGKYMVIVSNPTNSGKYVLAPGEREVFTVAGTGHTLREIFSTKTTFFGKPWYSIFQGLIGKFLFGASVFLGIIVLLIIYLIVRYRRKRRVKLETTKTTRK